MNFSLTDIIKTSAVILSGFALLSCSHDSFYSPETDTPATEGPVLGVTLSVGSTRAEDDPQNGGFEPGVKYENYLDIANGDFRMYFFEADGENQNRYIATFNPDVIPSLSPDLDPGSDTTPLVFKGPIPERVGKKFKLVVLANWGGDDRYPLDRFDAQGNPVLKVGDQSIYTIEDLTTNTFGQYSRLTSPEVETDWLSDNRLIPFYGVRSYDITSQVQDKLDSNGRLQEDIYVDLTKDADALPLLRAMAKIEVILDNPFAEFEDVKLTRVNAKGFCAPYKNSEDWKFEHTDYYNSDGGWDGNYVKGVHLTYGADANKGEGTNDDHTATVVQFKKYPRTEEKDASGNVTVVTPEKWVAYVPEYKNIGREDFTTIQVRLKDPTKENSGTDTPSAAVEGDSEAGSTADGDTSDDSMWVKQIYFAKGCTSTANATDGNRFDIERNNIYRFTVSGMNANLQCELDVVPYGEVKMEYTYGLERDKYGDIIVLSDPDSGEIDPYFRSIFYTKDENGNEVLNTAILPKQEDGTMLKRHPFPLVKEDADEYLYENEKDYYALVLKEGKFEVWLKDEEGCRVLTNFAGTDIECHARLVEDYSTVPMQEIHKDMDGDSRLWHYDNHATIIEGDDDNRYYKSKAFDGEDADGFDIPVDLIKKYLLYAWDQKKEDESYPEGSRPANPAYNTCWYELKDILSNPTKAELEEKWKWPRYPWGVNKKIDYSFPEEFEELEGRSEVVITTLQKVNANGHRIEEMRIKFEYKEEGDNVKDLTEYYFVNKYFTIPNNISKDLAMAYLTSAWRTQTANTNLSLLTQLPENYSSMAEPGTTIKVTISGPIDKLEVGKSIKFEAASAADITDTTRGF